MSDIVLSGSDSTSVSSSKSKLQLPAYGQMTNDRVVKEMQSVFKGFDYDPNMKAEQVFKSVEQIESYASAAAKELEQVDSEFKMNAVLNAGAIAAKRWHFGWVINKCLESASYGQGLGTKIAAAAGISMSYLYQYRLVGSNLDIRDAYTLGMYGAGWDLIRETAAVTDEVTRKNLIKMFVDSITDVNDSWTCAKVKDAYRRALKQIKQGPPEIDTSSPEQIETAANFENEAPEFAEAQKRLQNLMSYCRAFVKDRNLEPMLKAFADCFLAENVSNAEAQLETFHEQVEQAMSLLSSVESVLPQLKEELMSLKNMSLTKVEE